MNIGWLYINGRKIRYATQGTGKPLFMVNGLGANLETWTPLADKLSKDRELIMFDVPGIGRSPGRLLPRTMKQYADEIMSIALLGFGLEDFDILGYSWGGACAQEMVKNYPAYIRDVILVSTTPGLEGSLPQPHVVQMAANPIRYYSTRYAKAIAPFVHGNTDGEDELIANFKRPSLLGFTHQLMAISHWAGLQRRINETHRALIISGNNDPLLPHRNALVLSTKFKNSRLEIISGAGHLWVLSHADESSALINDFLGASSVYNEK